MALCGACKNKIQKTHAAKDNNNTDVILVFYIVASFCGAAFFLKAIENGTNILMSFVIGIVAGPILGFFLCVVGGMLFFLATCAFDDAYSNALKHGIPVQLAWVWSLICAILIFFLLGSSWAPIFFGSIS